MIVVRLFGGLGNQLFQYAAGRRLAHTHGAELVLDLAWYEHTPSTNTGREFELFHYPITARTTFGAEAFWCKLHSNRLLRRMPFIPRRWRSFREKGFDFDNLVLGLPDGTYLDGYWQSYRYFEDVADLIRVEFMPTQPPGCKDKDMQEIIVNTESVSLHVRRGDYVTQKAAAFVHGACSLDYYRVALTKLASLVRHSHLFIFSDDVEWARKNIKSPGPITFVDHNGPKEAFQDLRLMAQCKHHVIANSSFSWWGAWLNPRRQKIVIAPEVWFANCRPTPTLVPSTWIRL